MLLEKDAGGTNLWNWFRSRKKLQVLKCTFESCAICSDYQVWGIQATPVSKQPIQMATCLRRRGGG